MIEALVRIVERLQMGNPIPSGKGQMWGGGTLSSLCSMIKGINGSVCGASEPRFVAPFEILERIGPVGRRLALPPSLRSGTRCLSRVNAPGVPSRPVAHH